MSTENLMAVVYWLCYRIKLSNTAEDLPRYYVAYSYYGSAVNNDVHSILVRKPILLKGREKQRWKSFSP